MTLVLLSILAAMSISFFSNEPDKVKFDQTKRKIEVLRQAILGDDTQDNEGQRKNFGYHGDMGKVPGTLTDLITQGTQPAWSYSTYYGFGAGWRGPYLHSGFTGGPAITLDEWGKTFAYTTTPAPPTLTSYGADNKAGGTSVDTDISTQFSFNSRMATVKGIVAMNATHLSSQSVELRYPNPVSGSLTFNVQVSDANGYFAFSSVPFGVRSLSILGPSATVRPIPITVDTSDYQVPTSLLNLGQTVFYVPGSANNTGAGDELVQFILRSSYNQSLQLAAITVTWRNGGSTTGYVKQILLGGTKQDFTPVASGSRIALTSLLSLPSQNPNVNMMLTMCLNSDGSGTFDTSNYVFTITFEWLSLTKMDTVVFTAP